MTPRAIELARAEVIAESEVGGSGEYFNRARCDGGLCCVPELPVPVR